MPGIAPEFAELLNACAAICLEHHTHPRPVDLVIDREPSFAYPLNWKPATTQQRNTYGEANAVTVIERGALCLAIRAAERCLGLTVAKIAKTRTGFDYHLARTRQPAFQGTVRLEISGILLHDESEYRRRIRDKSAQMAPSDSMGLGYVAVVMFSTPITSMTKRA